jgi:hypothetical protein
MKRHTGLLFFILLFAARLSAGEKTDIVIMKNGDHFTCEIKRLDAGVLLISVASMLGTQSVDWADVQELHSERIFIIKTQNGTIYTGTIWMRQAAKDRPVSLEVFQVQGPSLTLDRAEVVRAEQSSENVWERFNGAINSGVIYSKGNQNTQYSLGAELKYPGERWSAGASFTSSLSKSSGVSASTRNYGSLQAMKLLRWDNWFYAGLADFLQSSEQGITLQTVLGGGIGRYLTNTNHAQISLLGGIAWQNTHYEQSTTNQPAQQVAAGLIATQVSLFRFDKTHLDVTGTLLPALSDPGRVRFMTNVGYYLKFWGDFTWNISFYGNWDNRAPHGFSGSDYGTSTGVGWTFGNR